MSTVKTVEYIFFYGLLAGVLYLVWKIIAPFAGALAFAAIVVTICYPFYAALRSNFPKIGPSLGAFISTVLVLIIVVLPVVLLGSLLLKEALSISDIFKNGAEASLKQVLVDVEIFTQTLLPSFSLDIATYVQQIANFIATNIKGILTGAASTVFLFFVSLIGVFYFFRDGTVFTKCLVKMSPLPDDEDEAILARLARAVRSVAVGVVLVAIIQGILTAIGFSLFGFERSILWGSVAAIGALIPGVGTSIVFIPGIIYLVIGSAYLKAAGLALWGAIAVGLIDNILGPQLMSRGNAIHPFMILLSVLGGIILFGPIGFILGPVVMSFLIVLLELYSTHMNLDSKE